MTRQKNEVGTVRQNRFSKYVSRLEPSDHTLPFIHTTAAYSFVEICGGDDIVPLPCEVFEEDLTYLFYGRPAYRTEKSIHKSLKYNWPFCFIIDPAKVPNIHAVYPFDTGAFALDLYAGIFAKRAKIRDFKLEGDIRSAQKLVRHFFGDERAYLNGSVDQCLRTH